MVESLTVGRALARLTMPDYRGGRRTRRPAGPPPPRPPTTPDPSGDGDLDGLADALVALAIVLRAHPAGAVEPDAGALELARLLVLAADDCLTTAATLRTDPAPYLGARAIVGRLPDGADWPPLQVLR